MVEADVESREDEQVVGTDLAVRSGGHEKEKERMVSRLVQTPRALRFGDARK